jgi:hypothetical protein
MGTDPPPWKPGMSRAEADAWAAGSVYARPVVHVTTFEAAASIQSTGFSLSHRSGGRVWGDGVYAAIDQGTMETYLRLLGDSGCAIELRVNVRRVLSVRISPRIRRPALEQVLAVIPDGLRQFIDARFSAADRAEAFTRVVTGAGYDALEILEDRFTPVVGGSQLVVYDPRRIVVVIHADEDNA